MRLSARYTHFWAKGKYYQHFWANATSTAAGNASGATITVTSSIIAGLNQTDASVSGQTLTDTLSLIAGIASVAAAASGSTLTATSSLATSGSATGGTGGSGSGSSLTITTTIDDGDASITEPGYLFDIPVTLNPGVFGQIDVTAPLDTRLNARYRHFEGRRKSYRHFWAQWEGAGISGSGGVTISSLVDIIPGEVSADFNTDGVTLEVDVTLDQGPITIITPGQMTVVSSVIDEGVASSEVAAPGDTITVGALIPDQTAPGGTVTVTTSVSESGTVFVPPDALAIPQPLNAVVVSLFPGVTISDAAVVGSDQEVVVELIAGEASVIEPGAVLPVEVSLIDGATFADPLFGSTLDVIVTLIDGSVVGDAIAGDTLTVTSSIIAGVATGEDTTEETSQSARAGGPVSYQRKPPEQVSIDAQAFGHNFSVGYGIVSGKPHVTPAIIAPQPAPITSPTHMMPVDAQVYLYPDVPLPESITKLLETPRPEPVEAIATPEPEPVKVKRDWIAYDNELLELI